MSVSNRNNAESFNPILCIPELLYVHTVSYCNDHDPSLSLLVLNLIVVTSFAIVRLYRRGESGTLHVIDRKVYQAHTEIKIIDYK